MIRLTFILGKLKYQFQQNNGFINYLSQRKISDFIFLKFIVQNYQQLMSKILTFTVKEKEIGQLLKLQELFHSHFMTQELLNEMVSLYVRLGQNISERKHPVKMYFMEKIKYVLSRPQITKMLEKENTLTKQSQNDNYQETLKTCQNEDMMTKKLKQEAMEEIRHNHLLNINKDRQYENTFLGLQLKNKERNMKIQLQMKIMEEIQQTRQKLSKDFQKVDEMRQKKQEQIQKIFCKQDEALNERLANRKKRRRRKSDDIKQQERLVEEIVAPPKEQLILVQKELNKTYERFTRLTMNKTKRGTQNGKYKENEGRVKIKLEEKIIEEEEFVNSVHKKEEKSTENQKISKKQEIKSIDKVTTLRDENAPSIEGTSIEYKTFDQTKGRVTMRMKQYEEIEDDQFLLQI